MLNVESPLGIPTHFLLLIPAESFKRECHITWIKDKQIGVRFNRSTS
ncbi:type IV pilus assembly PilZ [Afipia carboxidovorans OM5]|nr:type IV pilus assembly PilZ [Afipia carboxidovorans OM5]